MPLPFFSVAFFCLYIKKKKDSIAVNPFSMSSWIKHWTNDVVELLYISKKLNPSHLIVISSIQAAQQDPGNPVG